MPRTSSFELVDMALGGGLAVLLRKQRTHGATLEEIAGLLRSKHGIEVSRETVRRWLRDMGTVKV